MNTTITKDQMILHEGEVYLISKEQMHLKDYTWNGYRLQQWLDNFSLLGKLKITHSTAKLDGVQHLQREWFVKGEDVEEMAYNHVKTVGSWGVDEDVVDGFKAGYNAKKGEFTREEMVAAFVAGRETLSFNGFQPSVSEMFEKFMGSLRPLSIPNSLTLNKDNEIVKIEWE